MKIKRPLFIISISMLVVIYAINSMPGSAFMYSLALFALYAVFHYSTKNKYTSSLALSLCAAIFAIIYFSVYNNVLHNKINILSATDNITITGYITDKAAVSATSCYTVKLDTLNGKSVTGVKVQVYSDDLLSRGMKVELTGKYKAFTAKSNYIYNYSKGVFGNFYADKLTVIDKNGGITGFFSALRQTLIDNSRKIFDYKAVPVAVAMGLGDKSIMDRSNVDSFRFMGLSHALVVSGLHVGFIINAINSILWLLPVHKKHKNIVTLLFVILFMGIMGFTPSVIRAGFLVVSMLIGRNLFLETDNYTTLAVIIIITLLINPYSACNVSLLLSYSAYFGVVYRRDIAQVKSFNKIQTTLCLSTFAVIFTAPVMAFTGMDTTLLAPVFNLLFSPLIAGVCVMSFFLPVIYMLPVIGGLICFFFAPANELLIKLLMGAADFSQNNLGFAILDLGTDRVKFIVVFTVVFVLISVLQFENTTKRKILLLSIPVIGFLCYNYMNRNIVKLTVFDGSSNPSYIISREKENYLIVSENINQNRLDTVLDNLNIDNFAQIIICSKSEADKDLYSKYTDKIIIIGDTDEYTNSLFAINSFKKNRAYGYIIDIGGATIGFTHNKFDLSEYETDYYFLGADTPENFSSENSFYFSPINKSNTDIAREKQTMELFGNLTIKINYKTGKSAVIKDVKNFGGQL